MSLTTARAFFFVFFLWWNYVRVVTLKRLIGRIDLINFPPTKYSFLTKCCQILSHNKPAAVPSSNVLMSNVAGKGTEQRRIQPILLYFLNSLVLFVSWWLSPVELSSLVPLSYVCDLPFQSCVCFFFFPILTPVDCIPLHLWYWDAQTQTALVRGFRVVLVLAGHRGILVRWLPLIVYREIKSFQSEVAVCDEHLPPRHSYIKGLLWKWNLCSSLLTSFVACWTHHDTYVSFIRLLKV